MKERKPTDNVEPSGYERLTSYKDYTYDEDNDCYVPVEDTAIYGRPYFYSTCASCGIKKIRLIAKKEAEDEGLGEYFGKPRRFIYMGPNKPLILLESDDVGK